ncbi:hypothetical protein GBA52_014664 [Prunus armeniaca]|nr:hypothetical protein GBA52_014664 [Prunus armeniaca]
MVGFKGLSGRVRRGFRCEAVYQGLNGNATPSFGCEVSQWSGWYLHARSLIHTLPLESARRPLIDTWGSTSGRVSI